jgi:hypothetical protein
VTQRDVCPCQKISSSSFQGCSQGARNSARGLACVLRVRTKGLVCHAAVDQTRTLHVVAGLPLCLCHCCVDKLQHGCLACPSMAQVYNCLPKPRSFCAVATTVALLHHQLNASPAALHTHLLSSTLPCSLLVCVTVGCSVWMCAVLSRGSACKNPVRRVNVSAHRLVAYERG